jgi:hypothetical protein
VLKSGKLGKVKRMFADFSMNYEPDSELHNTGAIAALTILT